jgi:hypothetical protein
MKKNTSKSDKSTAVDINKTFKYPKKMEHFQIDEHILLRFAEEKDTPLILEFIRGLAEYEHLLDTVKIDEEAIKKYLF